jgi:hypothetical protein
MQRHSEQYDETPESACACAVSFSVLNMDATELVPWHSAKAYETAASGAA